MKWRRWILPALMVLGLAAVISMGLVEEPALVETGQVTRSTLIVSVNDEGQTRVRERYTLSAPVMGQLQRITLDAGDQITQGQVLAVITPMQATPLDERAHASAKLLLTAAQAALEQARASAKQAQADLSFANKELTRAQELAKADDTVLTREELDRSIRDAEVAQHAADAAKFAEQVAQADLASAQLSLKAAADFPALDEVITLRSPVDGVVLRIPNESARVVTAGEPLLEVGDPQALEIVVDLLSTSAAQVAPGARAIISRWGGEGELRATVRRIEPSGFTKISALGVEEQRVNVILDPSNEEAWSRLADGYRVEVAIVTWERKDALTVPASALFRYQDGWAVYRLDGSSAELVKVRVGQRTDLLAQVLEGLGDRDQVVLHPTQDVADGTSVQVRQE